MQEQIYNLKAENERLKFELERRNRKMIKSYDINDYLKDDKELQKAVIRELFKEITTQQNKIDVYQMSENEANEIIAELQAYKDVNEDFKTAYAELKAENEKLKRENKVNLSRSLDLNKEIRNLSDENAELKAENDRLKEEIKEVKKYQYEQEFLEKEIEEQREKNKRLTCKILEVKALNETLNVQCTSQDCTQLRKLHQTLQEIKTIAEENKDTVQYGGICRSILMEITKAEKE